MEYTRMHEFPYVGYYTVERMYEFVLDFYFLLLQHQACKRKYPCIFWSLFLGIRKQRHSWINLSYINVAKEKEKENRQWRQVEHSG